MSHLEIRELRLSYPVAGGGTQSVLDIDEWRVPASAAVGVTGPSGSGKTSLLYVVAGLERPQQGCVRWGRTCITDLSESERDRWRRHSVGMVFQDFHLLPGMTALQNVLLPATFDHRRVPFAFRERARALLSRVGLATGAERVEVLSRGELQRVAIARAMLFAPSILLADEPTASLDVENGRMMGDLLLEICRETGSTLLVVSHDAALLRRLDAVHTLINGRITSQPEPAGTLA
jgi:putative ABC transport system ATP-binding protein